MAQRSKNHHFIPKVLQRQFVAEPERIWHSKRGADGRFTAPQLRNIAKTFRRRNYYTVLESGENSDIVERAHYGAVDDYLGKLLPEVLGALNKGGVPVFSGESLDSIRMVVLEMIKRTPEFAKDYNDFEIGKELKAAIISATSEASHLPERETLLYEFANPDRVIAYGRNVRVRATLDRSDKIDSAFKRFSVRWSVIPSRHSYILSSLAAYRIGNGGPNGLSNPNMEIWMPISPKVCLVLISDQRKQVPPVVPDPINHTRQVNEFAARNSDEIASHSRKLLESLTGTNAG